MPMLHVSVMVFLVHVVQRHVGKLCHLLKMSGKDLKTDMMALQKLNLTEEVHD